MAVMQNFKKIAIGISGGVDSAVSAMLLRKKGFDVTGVFMRNWDSTVEDEKCDYDKDIEDAQWVCNKLQIPFKEVSFVKEYWTHVFQNMIDEYSKGLTPNPDILCNSFIKFDSFYHYCRKHLDVDAIAMGHYARSSFGPFLENFNSEQTAKLLKGVDESKDQSFFLSRISQEALQRTMFPIGNHLKSQVKTIAEENDLHRVLNRKESMGMCFVGKRNFRNFISQYVPDKEGRFIDVETGEIMGHHKGVHFYTNGQRSDISGYAQTYYVVHKDAQSGDIFVAAGSDHPALLCRSLLLSDDRWIVKKPEELVRNNILKCKFRFLHRKPLKDCTLFSISENCTLLDVDEPIWAAAPGQFAVFYDGEECLGSAKITNAGPSDYVEVEVASKSNK